MTGVVRAVTPTLRGKITKPSSGGSGSGEWTQEYTDTVIEIIHDDLGLEVIDGKLHAVYEEVDE